MQTNPNIIQFYDPHSWIDTWEASDILGITHHSVQKVLTESNDYQQVRRKLRGKAGKLSARGQGHLFCREDILRIAQIQKGARCGVVTAARFFAAERLGKI